MEKGEEPTASGIAELMKDSEGNWRAIKVEECPIVNAKNRLKRFKFLNYYLFNEDMSGNPLCDWTICHMEETDYDAYCKVCICGQRLKKWYIVARGNEQCNIGGGCITHFDMEFATDIKSDYHEQLKKCKCGKRKNMNHKRCETCTQQWGKLEKYHKDNPNNQFYKSLVNQFLTRGTLSIKQWSHIL